MKITLTFIAFTMLQISTVDAYEYQLPPIAGFWRVDDIWLSEYCSDSALEVYTNSDGMFGSGEYHESSHKNRTEYYRVKEILVSNHPDCPPDRPYWVKSKTFKRTNGPIKEQQEVLTNGATIEFEIDIPTIRQTITGHTIHGLFLPEGGELELYEFSTAKKIGQYKINGTGTPTSIDQVIPYSINLSGIYTDLASGIYIVRITNKRNPSDITTFSIAKTQ